MYSFFSLRIIICQRNDFQALIIGVIHMCNTHYTVSDIRFIVKENPYIYMCQEARCC